MSVYPQKIGMGSDHAGYILKEYLKTILTDKGVEIIDFGTHSEESADYPDYVHPLALAIKEGKFEKGIVVCGSGNGVSITANKHPHIRCALSWIPEIAKLGVEHNNANIVALPARYISKETAVEIIESFFSSVFLGGRHSERVRKMNCV